MLNSWQQLCRLCAKENGSEVDVFLKSENGANLAEAIQKYFLITINPYEQSPTMICTTCYKSITNLVLFAEHTSKVEAFFTKLMLNEFNLMDIDLNNLKFEHGLSEFVFSFPDLIQKCDQGTDTRSLLHEDSVNIGDKIKRTIKTRNSSSEDNTSNISSRKRKNMQNNDEIAVKSRPLNDLHISKLEDEENQSANEDDNIGDDLHEIKDETVDTENESEESEKSSWKPIKKRTKRIKKVCKIKKIDEKFQCDKCARFFKRAFTLGQHTKKCYSDDPQKYSCAKCGKAFQDKRRLQRHEIVHLPPELKFKHSCLYCDKKFSTATNAQTHIRAIHIGDKSYICEECGKVFKTNGALKEHKYVHVDDTPFECRRCPKKFKTMVFLKRHEDTHDDTFYTCPECGLKLNTKRTLQNHMIVHSDKKKYKCDYCGNEYKRAKALKNHLIIHSGLKAYTCPFCDKTFANGSNYRKHIRLSHPVELAEMEAAKQVLPQTTNIPKLSDLRIASTTSDSLSLSEHIINNTSSMSDVSRYMNQPASSTNGNYPSNSNVAQRQAKVSNNLQTLK